jgi:metallo-beta-lactamase class B
MSGSFGVFRSRVAAGLTLAILALAGPASSQSSTQALWREVIPPLKIIDNTYWVGTAGLQAVLITTPQGHFLIDVGLPENAPIVERNIETLGFKVKDIKYLLNTHSHFDHSGGLAKLKADSGATFVASQGDRYALENGVYEGSENQASLKFPAIKVDRVIADGGKLTLGGVTLTANITPGHTKGCTTWTWQVREAGKTLNVVDFCSASVAANRLAPNPQYPGIVEDYRKTFARAKSIKGDVFLAAHGDFFDLAGKKARVGPGKPNPFIDPTGFASFVARQEQGFNAELARQQAASQRAGRS